MDDYKLTGEELSRDDTRSNGGTTAKAKGPSETRAAPDSALPYFPQAESKSISLERERWHAVYALLEQIAARTASAYPEQDRREEFKNNKGVNYRGR